MDETQSITANENLETQTMETKMRRDEVVAVRHGVKAAFGELRKIGFITKINCPCCMTCAVAELSDIADKQQRNRAAYWHKQDEEHFRRAGTLHVRYCYLPPANSRGETNRIVTQIGEQVAAALRKAGLAVEWNGDPDKTIKVSSLDSLPKLGWDKESRRRK